MADTIHRQPFPPWTVNQALTSNNFEVLYKSKNFKDMPRILYAVSISVIIKHVFTSRLLISVDHDHMASLEASLSGLTVFTNQDKSGFSRTRVKLCFNTAITWVNVFRIIPEFRILRLTFHRKSASKC